MAIQNKETGRHKKLFVLLIFILLPTLPATKKKNQENYIKMNLLMTRKLNFEKSCYGIILKILDSIYFVFLKC